MALQGDLSTFDLAELLQWLESAKVTGCAVILQEGIERHLKVLDGALHEVAYPGQWEIIARRLTLAGLCTPEQASSSLLAARRGRSAFEATLTESGVSLEHACNLAAEDLKDTAAAILAARTGRFTFSEDPISPWAVESFGLHMNLRELLFEAFRMADEQPNVDRLVGDDATGLHATGKGSGSPSITARAALALVGSGTTVGALRFALSMPRSAANRQIYDLSIAGRIALDGKSLPPAPDPLAAMLAQGSALLRAGEYDAASLLCASLINADPTDRRVREFARAVETEQAAKLYAELLPPQIYEAIPNWETRAQKLRHDERQVLNLVNGVWDVATVTLASPLREAETLKALKRLVGMGIIRPRAI